jgi:MFS family permease
MRRAGPALGGALVLVVAMSVGRFAYTPLLPYMRDATGLSTSAAGWIASSNYLGYVAGALTANWLCGLLGLRATVRLGLVASTVTTAAMAITTSAGGWAVLRAVGGAASGWAMIAVSALVLTAAGDDRRDVSRASDRRGSVANRMFAGVGVGIILSTLLIAACAAGTSDPAGLWLALGAASVVCSLAADVLIGRADGPTPLRPPPGRRVPLPPDVRLLVASYACAGFGYVLTATYLVLIVRDADGGRWLEVVAWCVVGACAAVSTWFWARVGDRRGERRALVVAHVALAGGVMSAAFAPGTAGILGSAVLLGGTFAGITGVGVDLARRSHPADPTRAIAAMTTAFAVGQVVGPAVGGWLADHTGTFRVPSVIAAVVLLAGGGLLLIRTTSEQRIDAKVTA